VGLGFSLIIDNPSLYLLFKVFVALVLADYALSTIGLLLNRKRKIIDTTTYYWYFAMLMLLASIGLSVANEWLHMAQLNTMVVVVFIYGFAMSVITGMMYKIVPFLVWFHLTNEGYMSMPTMHELIGKKLTTIQFILHVLTLLSLAIFAFDSSFQIATGVLMVLSNALLLANLIKGSKIYFTKRGLQKMSF
jgi:hypothetical protein